MWAARSPQSSTWENTLLSAHTVRVSEEEQLASSLARFLPASVWVAAPHLCSVAARTCMCVSRRRDEGEMMWGSLLCFSASVVPALALRVRPVGLCGTLGPWPSLAPATSV